MSEDVFYATVVGEDRVRNFDRLPEIAQQIIFDKVEAFAERMARLAEDLRDQRLGQKTGRMASTPIQSEVRVIDGKVQGRVFIEGIPYAAIQERGGTTPAHMIYPREAKVLAFFGATGEKVFARRVLHPGGTIEGKHFMKDAYRQMGPEISRGLKKAMVEGIRAKMRSL
jgi:hypothetical protein